jgi:biopolymer transport protein TolQ
VWSLVFSSSWFALAILAVLILLSILSWAIIVSKWMLLRRVVSEDEYFYGMTLREQPLSTLAAMAQKLEFSPRARLFEHAHRELALFRTRMEKAALPDGRERLIDTLSRTLERIYNQESQRLERQLPLLATVSSASPYIGLFGTVLGIIGAFQEIGISGVTSLAVVAPGISQALIATAAGLLAAIPALIAYNIFRNRLREINSGMKNFALEITNRLERAL